MTTPVESARVLLCGSLHGRAERVHPPGWMILWLFVVFVVQLAYVCAGDLLPAVLGHMVDCDAQG